MQDLFTPVKKRRTLTELQTSTIEEIQKHFAGNEIIGLHVALAINLKERERGMEGADVRAIIHALRVKGYPICANRKGYYWARNQTELDEFLTDFGNRIYSQKKALEGMVSNSKLEV